MRTFTIPEPIVLVDRVTGKEGDTVPFKKVAIDIWCNSDLWEKPRVNRARLVRVLSELEKPEGDLVQIQDDDWKVLCEAIENPQARFPTMIGLQLMAFENVVLGAKQEP